MVGGRVPRLSYGFSKEDLQGEWKDVALVIMKYITLDEIYKRFHSRLFSMLSHFKHGKLK